MGSLYWSNSRPIIPGTIFKIDASDNFIKIVDLNTLIGSRLRGGLTKGPDEYYYGATEYEGANRRGTIFKINDAGNMIKLIDLNTVTGNVIFSRMTLGSDGWLYGIFDSDGLNGYGTIFKINSVGDFVKLKDFDNTNYYQQGSLKEISYGTFIGTTGAGGSYGGGIIFKITSNGNFTTIFEFNPSISGGGPSSIMKMDPSNLFSPNISAGKNFLFVNSNGGIINIMITSNISWNVISSSTLLGISTTSGINNGTISVTVPGHLSSTSGRNFTISISGSNQLQIVTIDQLAVGQSVGGGGGTSGPGPVIPPNTVVSQMVFSNNKEELKIFPNPNQGSFTIDNLEDFNSIIITNIQGDIVYKQSLVSGINEINTNLSIGLYFVIIDNKIFRKIQVQH